MRETDPNFYLLMNSAETESSEIKLENIPTQASPDRANALFTRGATTDRIREIQAPYFELIRSGLSEAALQESAKRTNETLMTNRSKPFAALESKLIALMAPLGHLYRTEADINNAITKLKRNYIENGGQDFKPELVNKYFPTARGLFNALDCYRFRSRAPLAPNLKRSIFLQAELDAKSDTDFVEVVYDDSSDLLKISELNFIQVKSSAIKPEELASIQRKHEMLAQDLASNLEKAQQRFYPEVEFKSQEEKDEALINIGLEMSVSQNDPDHKTNSIDVMNAIVQTQIKNSLLENRSRNAPVRLEVKVIFDATKILEQLNEEESWLIFYQDSIQHLKDLKPQKAAHWLKEMKRLIDKDPNSSEHLKTIIYKIIAELPADQKSAFDKILLPQVVPIESISSITTIGRKEVPNGKKPLSLDKKRLMVMRKAA